MDEDETFAFLLGIWVKVPSSNVVEARYLEESDTLEVGFDGGDPSRGTDYYAYPGVSFNEAQQFAMSDSKGVWIDRNLKKPKRPYFIILKTSTPTGRRGKGKSHAAAGA